MTELQYGDGVRNSFRARPYLITEHKQATLSLPRPRKKNRPTFSNQGHATLASIFTLTTKVFC